jgi:hypothetical protein
VTAPDPSACALSYKKIKSASHDWTYWFMSGTQYIDGRFVFEDMRELARARPTERLTVSWIPAREDELAALTPRVRKCIAQLRNELPSYLERCKVDAEVIAELRTEVYVGANARLYVRAFARDDRGREYKSFIGS